MEDTVTSTPPPQEVLYRIHQDGKNADLSFLNIHGTDIKKEKEYLKTLTVAKRKYLSEKIIEWNNDEKAEAEKLPEREATRKLLVELSAELKPPTAVEEFTENRAEDFKKSAKIVANKVGTDLVGLGNPEIGYVDKAMTALKYGLITLGAYTGISWLIRKASEKWHKVTGNSRTSHVFKWLLGAGIAGTAVVGGASVIANTTDRSMGPRLGEEEKKTEATPPSPAASVDAPKPVEKEKEKEVDLLRSGTPLMIDGMDVRFKETDKSMELSIDGKNFELSGRLLGFSLSLNTYLKTMKAHESGDYYTLGDLKKKDIDYRISKAEAAKMLRALKDSPATEGDLKVEVDVSHGKKGFKKEKKGVHFVQRGIDA